jgi:hypothetical protein
MAEAFRDPRHATSEVVEGPEDLRGPVEIFRPFVIEGREVALPAPLIGVSEYVAVARAETEANSLRERLLENLDVSDPQIAYQNDPAMTFGFYAAAGTAVSEAIVGLEAFANRLLGSHFDQHETLEIDDRVYSRRDARNKPINERLSDLLPRVRQVDRPTLEDWWPTFRRIQGLAALKRHGVYEALTRSGLTGEKEFIQRLIDGEYRGAGRMMLDAFEFFAPGWVKPERLAKLPQPPGA